MNDLFSKPGSVHNSALRLMAAYILLFGQCFLCSGGCDPNQGGSNQDGAGQILPPDGDGDSVPDDGAQSAGGGGTSGGGQSPTLEGSWVVELGSPSQPATWGNAEASVWSAALGEIKYSMQMDDGTHTDLIVVPADAGALSGRWIRDDDYRSLESMAHLSDEDWTGTLSADGMTITGTWASSDGPLVVVLRRARSIEAGDSGVWTRSADAAVCVVAYDGQSTLLSVLDASGDWPSEGRADNGVARVFDGGARMHWTDRPTAVRSATLLDRAATQSSLTGRWVGGDRRAITQPTVIRHARVVVGHNDTLYVHEGATRLQRIRMTGNELADDTPGYEWTGRLSPDAARIAGEWTGYPGWYNSMDRAVTPQPGVLNGAWYSLSVDSSHYPVVPATTVQGTATVTQDGDRVQITDQAANGTTYRVEATWRGDHYEGTWAPADQPAETSPWRGEFLANGWYLHGTWELGEYSFVRFPVQTNTDLNNLAPRTLALVADPYQDIAMAFRNPDRGLAVTMYRHQDWVSGFTHVTPNGTLETTVDERLRPTRMVGPDWTAAFVWANDSTSVEVTFEQNGVSATSTAAVDLSDAALLSALAESETQTGEDLSPLRNWLTENPGLVSAIARGEQLSPSVGAVIHAAMTAGGKTSPRMQANQGSRDPKVAQGALIAIAGTAFLTVGVSLALEEAATAVLGVGGVFFVHEVVGATMMAGAATAVAWAGLVVVVSLVILLGLACLTCTLDCFLSCGSERFRN